MYRVVNWGLGVLGYVVYLRMRQGALPLPVNSQTTVALVEDATGSMEGAAV